MIFLKTQIEFTGNRINNDTSKPVQLQLDSNASCYATTKKYTMLKTPMNVATEG